MTDILPPDYATPIGQIRLLVGDTDDPYVFHDAQIQAMLVIYSNNIRLVAAEFLDRIAMDTVLLYKVVRTDDLQVDGAKMAQFFKDRAANLRREDAEDALSDAFEVAYPWGRLETYDTVESGSVEGLGYYSWGS